MARWKGKQHRKGYTFEKRTPRCQPEAVEYWDQAENATWEPFEESRFIIITIFIYCQRYRENEVTRDKRHKTAIPSISKWFSKAFLSRSGRWCTYSLSIALGSQAGKDKQHITEEDLSSFIGHTGAGSVHFTVWSLLQ